MQLRFLSRDCGWSKAKIEERIKELIRSIVTEEIKELASQARKLGLQPDDLDEVIHDIASHIASSTNNQVSTARSPTGRRRGTRASMKSNRSSALSPGRNTLSLGSPRAAKAGEVRI